MFNILITCAGGELSPWLYRMIKSSQRHQVTLVSVDARDDVFGQQFSDYFYQVPKGIESGYVSALIDICQRHDIHMILPLSDEEVLTLAKYRNEIESKTTAYLACPLLETAKILTNKADTYEFLKNKGIPVPVWKRVCVFDELEAWVSELLERYDGAVVKPTFGRCGRGVYVIQKNFQGAPRVLGREIHLNKAVFLNEYKQAVIKRFPAVVMQPLIAPVYDMDILAWNGVPMRRVTRRRYSSTDPNAGHLIMQDAVMLDYGQKIATAFGLSGLFDCDMMYDVQGQLYLLEINPRASGSVVTSIEAGVPLLDDLISLVKGESLADITIPVNKRVIPYKSLMVI